MPQNVTHFRILVTKLCLPFTFEFRSAKSLFVTKVFSWVGNVADLDSDDARAEVKVGKTVTFVGWHASSG